MTSCAASRAAAACGAGSVREPLMPAFARGGLCGGERERGPPLSSARRPGLDRLRRGRRAGPGAGWACYGVCAYVEVSVRCWTVQGAWEALLSRRAAAACGPALRPAPAQGMGVDLGQDVEPRAGYRGRDRAQAGVRRSAGVDGGRLRSWRRRGPFDDVGSGPGFVGRRCGLRRGGREYVPLVWGPPAGSMAALPSSWTLARGWD